MLNSYLRHRMADATVDDITEVMALSGSSRNTINKLFRNDKLETLKIGSLIKLCDAFHCKLSDLLVYEPEIEQFNGHDKSTRQQ